MSGYRYRCRRCEVFFLDPAAEELARPLEGQFEALFGSADYAKIAAFRRWMRAHPQAMRIREDLNRPGGD